MTGYPRILLVYSDIVLPHSARGHGRRPRQVSLEVGKSVSWASTHIRPRRWVLTPAAPEDARPPVGEQGPCETPGPRDSRVQAHHGS